MSKNQIIKYPPAINNRRVETLLTREIKATPGTLLALACPVEELRWIPGWSYGLIYSKSGVNETNCIFTEEVSGPHFFEKPLTTTWVTAVHDPHHHHIVFLLNISGKAVIRLEIRFREVGPKITSATWQMVFTALDVEANAMDEEVLGLKMNEVMGMLADALKHYGETGRMVG